MTHALSASTSSHLQTLPLELEAGETSSGHDHRDIGHRTIAETVVSRDYLEFVRQSHTDVTRAALDTLAQGNLSPQAIDMAAYAIAHGIARVADAQVREVKPLPPTPPKPALSERLGAALERWFGPERFQAVGRAVSSALRTLGNSVLNAPQATNMAINDFAAGRGAQMTQAVRQWAGAKARAGAASLATAAYAVARRAESWAAEGPGVARQAADAPHQHETAWLTRGEAAERMASLPAGTRVRVQLDQWQPTPGGNPETDGRRVPRSLVFTVPEDTREWDETAPRSTRTVEQRLNERLAEYVPSETQNMLVTILRPPEPADDGISMISVADTASTQASAAAETTTVHHRSDYHRVSEVNFLSLELGKRLVGAVIDVWHPVEHGQEVHRIEVRRNPGSPTDWQWPDGTSSGDPVQELIKATKGKFDFRLEVDFECLPPVESAAHQAPPKADGTRTISTRNTDFVAAASSTEVPAAAEPSVTHERFSCHKPKEATDRYTDLREKVVAVVFNVWHPAEDGREEPQRIELRRDPNIQWSWKRPDGTKSNGPVHELRKATDGRPDVRLEVDFELLSSAKPYERPKPPRADGTRTISTRNADA